MYWIYNILLFSYWLALLPSVLYQLIVRRNTYRHIKSIMGFLPLGFIKKIEKRPVIWIHAASIGEVVATSHIVKTIKQEFPNTVVVLFVVTRAGYAMAQRIIPEAEEILFFPLDQPFLLKRLIHIIKPSMILLIETELWPNFLRIAKKEKIPIMMVNGRISDRSLKRYQYISAFTKEMLGSINRFCMQSKFDAAYIEQLGAPVQDITVTGNMKYDQTYATVSEEEKQSLLDEFGFCHNHPIIVAGSTHKGEEEVLFHTFITVLEVYPQARMLIAPREIMRGKDVQNIASRYGLLSICRSAMKEPVHEGIPVVVLDTIGELGRLYSLGDIIFVGGSLVKTGGHNILEPAAHSKPIVVGPHMFNFKEIFNLLHSRQACLQVRNGHELTDTILRLCGDAQLREDMGRHCMEIMAENKGATHRNIEEIRMLFKKKQIIP